MNRPIFGLRFLMNFPVYVVSLPCATERRNLIAQRLGAIGLSFSFIDAIDGRSQEVEPPTGMRLRRECFASNSAIACTLSHLKAFERMLFEGADRASIVEDDAIFDSDFISVLEVSLSFVSDVVKFEGRSPKYYLQRHTCGNRSFVTSLHNTPGAACYLISREAAERILSISVLDEPIDGLLDDWRLSLKVLDVIPRVADQDRTTLQTQNMTTHRAVKSYGKAVFFFCWHIGMIEKYGLADVSAMLLQRIAKNCGLRRFVRVQAQNSAPDVRADIIRSARVLDSKRSHL